MANEKEPTKLYKVRNGYAVMKGNQVIKEGNVELTDKEHTLQSWKVEPIIQVHIAPRVEEKEETTEPHQLSDVLSNEIDKREPNIDRSVKKSKFNRAVKTPKG